MTLHVQNAQKLDGAISTILSRIMVKDVQELYSGFGRMVKGVGKFNFSITNTCKIIQGMMIIIYMHTSILILGGGGGTGTLKIYQNIIT